MGFLALSMLFGLVVASSLNLAAEAVEEGSSASEKFAGTDKDDYFDAKNGNDLLIGQGGNDTLAGGNGNDWLVGAAGTDLLKGDAGADVIIGGSGVDTLVGGAGNDFIEAANIVDTPRLDASLTLTSSFRDIAFEYSLPNTSDEGDSIDAGAGDDTIVLGADDTLTSGSGADEISIGDWIKDNAAATILDFDSEEDVLVFTYQKSSGIPQIDITRDEDEDLTEIRANGYLVAQLHKVQGFATSDNLRFASY